MGRSKGAISKKTQKALALVGTKNKDGNRITRYRAALMTGISLSTIYRAKLLEVKK